MAKTRFTTPVMRMVQGSADEPQTQDQQGNLRVVKTGPNAGQPNPQYFVAGAIPKDNPDWPAFWALLVNQAVADFPNLFPQGAAPVIAAGGPGRPTPAGSALVQAGIIAHPKFSFKIADGDGYDDNGKLNSGKEGFAGHWILRFASSYPPRCFHAGRYAAAEQIQEKNAIKRGFFIRVNGATEGNAQAGMPGLYLNLDMIELAGIGPEIVSGPDAGEAFGSGPGALPTGATAIPAPAAAAAPPPPPAVAAVPAAPAVVADPMAAARAAGWQPHPQAPGYHYLGAEVVADAEVAARFNAAAPVPPAAPAAPVPAPTPAPVEPYTGFMAPEAAPVAPVASPPPAAPSPPASTIASPSSPTMTAKAGGTTYEAMIAAGWTDATLREHGMMV